MARNYKKKIGGRSYKTSYSEEAFSNTLRAIWFGGVSIQRASQQFSIPYTSLQNKIKGSHPKQIGGQKRLSVDFEKQIVSDANALAYWKVPLGGLDIRHLVKIILMLMASKIRFSQKIFQEPPG